MANTADSAAISSAFDFTPSSPLEVDRSYLLPDLVLFVEPTSHRSLTRGHLAGGITGRHGANVCHRRAGAVASVPIRAPTGQVGRPASYSAPARYARRLPSVPSATGAGGTPGRARAPSPAARPAPRPAAARSRSGSPPEALCSSGRCAPDKTQVRDNISGD